MQDAESSRSIHSQLDGESGKIELMESSIRITLYKTKLFSMSLRRNWDKSKIKDVKDIPAEAITNVSISRNLPGGGAAINISFPEAGMLGYIPIFLSKEQISDAEKMAEMLKDVSQQVTLDFANEEQISDAEKMAEMLKDVSQQVTLDFANEIDFDICPICETGRLKVTEKKGIFSTSHYVTCDGCNLKLNDPQTKKFMKIREFQKNIALEKWSNEISCGRGFPVENLSPILLKKNETAIFTIPNIILSENRSVRTGTYGSSRIRVAKGISIGGGSFRSQSHEELTELDKGSLTLTNQRIVFMGHSHSLDIPLKNITFIEPYLNAIVVGREGKTRSEQFTGIDKFSFDIAVDSRTWTIPLNGGIIKFMIEALYNA
jgi:hypothetical protein